jgi:hypothetical protein
MPPLLTQVARVSDGLPLVATQTPAHGIPVTPKDQQEAREILKKITSRYAVLGFYNIYVLSIDMQTRMTNMLLTVAMLCFCANWFGV